MLETCHPAVRCTVNIIRWIPVIFITGVLVWSYYAYTVELCIFTVQNLVEKIIYLFFFNVIFFLLFWSYWRTMFTKLHKAPENFRLPVDKLDEFLRSPKARQNEILENFADTLPILTRSYTEGVRYCPKCVILKPDRAHHCGICGVCLLKMDHHCPWVNACVHWGNYKYFVLFLGYALLFCVYVFFTDFQFFIFSWRQDGDEYKTRHKSRFHILFLFFVSGMFAVSVACLFFYHMFLTARNRTTIEACYAPSFKYGSDKNGFNLGVAGNFRQVFGPLSLRAFLPVPSFSCDGVAFPTRRSVQAPPMNDYKSMTSLDGRCVDGRRPSGNNNEGAESEMGPHEEGDFRPKTPASNKKILTGTGGSGSSSSRMYRGPAADQSGMNGTVAPGQGNGRGKYVLMRQCESINFYYDNNYSSQDEI